VADALAGAITALPTRLTKSLTWDLGQEMAQHRRFTVQTGIQVLFCDPKSPWQRGSNENTNGVLRQYLPRRLDFRTLTQADLDTIAQELNERPRQTLGFKTPSQALAEQRLRLALPVAPSQTRPSQVPCMQVRHQDEQWCVDGRHVVREPFRQVDVCH
jgi:IS30 family transposase